MKCKNIVWLVCFFSFFSCTTTESVWYKGNTHTHSLFSDGDSPVQNVIRWYHDNGYHFLFLTDHNYPLQPDTVKPVGLERSDFILIRGNEVSDVNAVHTTALNTDTFIPTVRYYKNGVKKRIFDEKILDSLPKSKTDILRMHIEAIRSAGGIPIVNHPNFLTGLQVSDILPVKGMKHIEVFNGHPEVYNWGNKLHRAVESKWDSLLVNHRLFYGVASDDEHILLATGRDKANPGRGWIMVRSGKLTTDSILSSVERGDFYSSNGVILKDYCSGNGKISIEIDEKKTLEEIAAGRGYYQEVNPCPDSDEFQIEFIGYNGVLLKKVRGVKAEYSGKPADKYMRVRASYRAGDRIYFAWCQPLELADNFFTE